MTMFPGIARVEIILFASEPYTFQGRARAALALRQLCEYE
jgi:hypothetical protein